MKKPGYYTLEAVFVMSICIWVIVALCYGGFYVHDKVVLESETNACTAAWLAEGKGASGAGWQESLKKQLNEKLLLFRVKSVKAGDKILYETVSVNYELGISLPLLQKSLAGNKVKQEYKTSREMIIPAKYKWDAEK